MATADNNKEIINSLITASNETTGKNDADLTEAVKSLISGFGAGGGGGTLGLKSGTVDIAGGYNLSISHGCGKLPKWVLIEAPNDTPPQLNSVALAFWQDNYASFAVIGSTTTLLNGIVMQKYENIEPDVNANAVKVDEEQIKLSLSLPFITATYTWYAIYEV